MEDAEKVWKSYAATKDPALRQQLILEYASLVKFIAGRLSIYIGQHVDYDDLVSFGIFGLIDAIDKFDVAKGNKFETYASRRIRGAIIDSIRKMDWAPRSVRERNKKLSQAFMELESELGREPADQEIADKLNLSLAETQKIISKSAALSLISLDGFLEQNQGRDHSITPTDGEYAKTPDKSYEEQEMKEILARAIDKLNDQEKKVITLYYYEQLTVKEISAVMGVSESRVSQIHTKAIMRLQTRLGKHKSLLFEK
ncbi:MAG: FliA/WhiG family RNA polymerase sigma factor [Clostridiales bacterium]|jgi:RNA polymerase sigma factor for flagellar operon FliA|nr:FliA/WhiG family RNA polymerase sigma factor [Clostridiales bacterium]